MSSLPDDLDALSAGAPPVADWPGLVRATVRARRRRRAVVSAAAALSLVAVSGIGVVYAAGGDRDPSTLVAATPGPTPSPTVSSACGGELVAPTLPVPESDGDEVNDVTLAVTVSCTTVRVGEDLVIAATAVGDLARPSVTVWAEDTRYGDGALADCAALPSGPVDYADEPSASSERVAHAFRREGVHTVTVAAATLCGAPPGRAVEAIRVTVLPAATSSPAPTEADSPSPRASAPATPAATRTTAAPEPTYPRASPTRITPSMILML